MMTTLSKLFILLITTSLCVAQIVQPTNTFINRCPAPINLVIGGNITGTIPAGGTVNTNLGFNTGGFFFTDANGGNANGVGTTRVGFFIQDSSPLFYYIVKDPNHFNTAISVTPNNHLATNGFCVPAECDDISCADAFSQPPTGFPASSATPPSPPLFSCPFPNVTYTFTFCPGGSFPSPTTGSVALHPNSNTAKCLDVQGNVLANGTPVQIFDCNGTGAQKWVLSKGITKVQLSGTNFCLDAGSNPANGVRMKIWQCFDNLPAQQWFYTSENGILLQGQGLCLDLKNGNTVNMNKVQTWKCTNGNANQIWTE